MSWCELSGVCVVVCRVVEIVELDLVGNARRRRRRR